MTKELLDVAFIAAGGGKNIKNENIPFLYIGKDGKTLIEECLDTVVNTDVKQVVIWTTHRQRLEDLLRNRTSHDNNYKPVHVVNSNYSLGYNFLHALCEYTKFSDSVKPFDGDWKNPDDFNKYVKENPDVASIKTMLTSCDIPFESHLYLNKAIERYFKAHYDNGIDMVAVLTKKRAVKNKLRKIVKDNPEFKKFVQKSETTIFNYFVISKKHIRLSNLYFLNPFKAKRTVFNFVDDMYSIRYLSSPSNWPEVGKLILKYTKDNPELNSNLYGVFKQIIKSVISCDAVRSQRGLLSRLIRIIPYSGGSSRKLCYYGEMITGLKSQFDFRGSAGSMFDIDDEKSYIMVNKFYDDLKKHLKN